MSATATRVMHELVDQLIELINKRQAVETVATIAAALKDGEQPLDAEAKVRLLDVAYELLGGQDVLLREGDSDFEYASEVIDGLELLGVLEVLHTNSMDWGESECYHSEFIPELLKRAKITRVETEFEAENIDAEILDIDLSENNLIFCDSEGVLWATSSIWGSPAEEGTTVQQTSDGLLFTNVWIGGLMPTEEDCLVGTCPVFDVLVNEEAGTVKVVQPAPLH